LERAPAGALAAMPRAEIGWDGSPGHGSSEPWTPLQPQLDLAETTILPRPADPAPPDREAEAVARQVASALTAVTNDVRHMTLAAIRIVDPWGVVVVSPVKSDLGFGLAAQEEVAQALRGLPATRLREREVLSGAGYGWGSLSRNSDLRVFVAVPVLAEGHVLGAVLASRTPRNILQTFYSKRYALLELAIVLIGTVMVLAWFAGYTVVRPTRQLAAMARRVAGGEIRAVEPLVAPMTREAQSLSDSIVVLARTLEARADDVRDLALGISHEFKTPLTGIRGSAELLRDHPDEMSADERRHFLSNILADTDRLERLVRRILELARADALTPRGDERCDVAGAAAEIVSDLRGKGHRVSMAEMPATLPCAIDRASFDIVLSNLLENARQHGGEDVSVEISGKGRADGAVIDVSDDGIGVSAANAGRIFDRFFTTARDAGGSGLGLAIARQRVKAFGGDLLLVPSARGASFRIRLRAA
jgi:signal transduction histidine kinase